MQRLRWKQMQAVLNALEVLHSDFEPATLPLRMLNAVNTAIASENVMVDSFGAANEMKSLAQYPAGLLSPPEYAALAHNLPYHPLFAKVVLTRQTKSFRMKDVVAMPKFRRTPLYNEMFRPLSISDQLVFGIKGLHNSFITCCLSRAGREYTEAERRMASLINTHFVPAVRAAQSLESMRSVEVCLQGALQAPPRGMIVLTPDAEIKYVTDSAILLMQKYFGRSALRARKLPRKIDIWLRRAQETRRDGDFHPPPTPVRTRSADAELRISLTFNSTTGEGILLVEEKIHLSPDRIQTLGLTRREAEVLFWVAQGKTDWEVGILCGISPRTVQIHLARIYTKLGVENRTAATLKVLELLQS